MRKNQPVSQDTLIAIEAKDDNNYFNMLPNELIVYIFSYLDARSIAEISQVCKRFFSLILNNSKLILYERFNEDVLSLSLTNEQLLGLIIEHEDVEELEKSLQDIPNLVKNKNPMSQLSPFKLNGFFVRGNDLIQQSKEIKQQNTSKIAAKKVGTLFFSAIIPIILGYLSGSYRLLIYGIILGSIIFLYGIYKGLSEEAILIERDITNTSSIYSLFNSARRHSIFTYDKKTVEFMKKYP